MLFELFNDENVTFVQNPAGRHSLTLGKSSLMIIRYGLIFILFSVAF
jgi:hypothetical protein